MAALPPIQHVALTAQPAVTINGLVAALSARLGVPSNAYWSTAELTGYVIETLRCWNALTRHWKKRIALTTTPGKLFYDITADPALAYTVKDTDLISTMEYQLLEPATPTAWTGSEMFTLGDFTAAVQRRRDQFLVGTGCVLSEYSVSLTATPIARFPLSEAVIDVRRVVLQDQAGKFFQMSRQDEFALSSFFPSWSSAAKRPRAWSIAVAPPFQMQVAPPPSELGTLQLLVVAVGPVLDPAVGVVLGIPDDLTWVNKWGALADLLGKDSPARDPGRAQYCETRYQQGVEIARAGTTAMNAAVNGNPTRIDSVFDLDYYRPTWHNSVGAPKMVAMAGRNMMAPDRMPDERYGITLDVAQNAPVSDPAADLSLSPSVADAMIDYAEHLAAFKMGGEEFMATMPHYRRFMQAAGMDMERFSAAARFAETLTNRETKEEIQRWRRKPVSAG
jgi:hypothetical protein